MRLPLAATRLSMEGNWYVRASLDNSVMIQQHGQSDDLPVSAKPR